MELHPSVLTQFCRTQAQLMAAFTSLYPGISFTQVVLDIPRQGRVDTDGAAWTFQRHGAGLRFTSAVDGRVVDMHQNLPRSDVIDTWRLLQYLESQGADELEFATVEKALGAAAKRLRLNAIGDQAYEFSC
ncbi:hypothetical protein ASC70_05925 [Caulobacter sp. Root343]|uniref:DUF6896 domain-containing protein n=2 Tax=unclassified Caulobacter TaxID=2648921 RepID=UPI0006FBB040|nr:hypothetical protein [Caulobacter sp. Root342]KQV55698.1 hypothetical protein ASC62_17330 [Caulobacter sp. Root342]KQV71131.1 hypothetical protein ASC70_05925 [Caulobacter sp. Root343]